VELKSKGVPWGRVYPFWVRSFLHGSYNNLVHMWCQAESNAILLLFAIVHAPTGLQQKR
jgi:aspartate/tyrosine/aromatic aminotransferase